MLLLLTALSIYGVEGYLKANAQDRIARREVQSRQAIYAAEGGIEWAKSELLLDPDWKIGELSLAGGQVTVTAESNADLAEGGYLVTSTAHAGWAVRKIAVCLKRSPGRWLVLRYQEMHQ